MITKHNYRIIIILFLFFYKQNIKIISRKFTSINEIKKFYNYFVYIMFGKIENIIDFMI